METTNLQNLGNGMVRHRNTIQAIQWVVVLFYFGLLIYPALQPVPPESAYWYTNLTLFAQFLFWGIWWPFVILSMMLVGRVWCGVFCPEGTLTEAASRVGLGRSIPRWIRWSGWPFVGFALLTIYGQLISVYEYPKAALVILGGSTLMALAIGFVYGKGKRVWCRYLCPVNGVFALLSRLSPFHFKVNSEAWKNSKQKGSVDCAPLLNIRGMTGAADCHMCGRCSGHKDAITLSTRPMNQEILMVSSAQLSRYESGLLIYGLLGIATGAFLWSSSSLFITLKQTLAEFSLNHGLDFLLSSNIPWWILTHYPEAGDSFTWLDGFCIIVFILTTSLVMGGSIHFMLWRAGKLLNVTSLPRKLALALTPLGGLTIFLGLSSLTVNLVKHNGWLSHAVVSGFRASILAIAILWSSGLAIKILAQTRKNTPSWRRLAAFICFEIGIAINIMCWVSLFWM